nr:structural protein [Riboviria sp.]
MTNKQANRKQSRKSVRATVNSILLDRAEHKYRTETHATATTSTAAGISHALSRPIVEGDEVDQRSGRQIRHIGSELRFSVNLPSAAISGVFRYIWVIDRLNNGVDVAVTDVLESASVTSGYNTNALISKRFIILKDVSQSMVVASTTQHVTPVITTRRSYNIHFSGATNVAASNGVGAQFLITITDLGLNAPIYSLECLTHYLDM